jgi:hypothetical protein
MFLPCLPVFGHFLVQRIHFSNFYVKHKFPCFRRKFGDQSTLRVVDFRLEGTVTPAIRHAIWRRLYGIVGLSVVLKFCDHALDLVTNCGVHAFEPMSSRKAHRGGTVRHCRSIKGHDDVDRMGEADTSPCFLLRGSSRLLRYLLFCLLFLFVYLLFPTLVLILLAFVSHCVPPFPVIPHLLAKNPPPGRHCT